jgi:hypothetical protein
LIKDKTASPSWTFHGGFAVVVAFLVERFQAGGVAPEGELFLKIKTNLMDVQKL